MDPNLHAEAKACEREDTSLPSEYVTPKNTQRRELDNFQVHDSSCKPEPSVS